MVINGSKIITGVAIAAATLALGGLVTMRDTVIAQEQKISRLEEDTKDVPTDIATMKNDIKHIKGGLEDLNGKIDDNQKAILEAIQNGG